MSGKSDYLENKVLDHALGQTSYTQPTPYLALYTATPSDAGGGTEVSGGSYARQAIAADFGAASGGSSSNTGDISFPQATALWGDVEAFGILDSSGAGNLLYWGHLVQTYYEFTAEATADTFTAPGHALVNTDVVVLVGASLPTGVSASTEYYVISVSGDDFQLSLTEGGAAINISSAGSGKVGKLTKKTIESGDQAIFRTGTLTVTES